MPGFVLEKEIMMSLKNDLLDELSYEKDELEKAEKLASKYPNVVLTFSKGNSGKGQFYTFERETGEKKYLKKSNIDKLRGIALGRYIRQKLEILKANIEAIDAFNKAFRDYDHNSLIQSLPKSYQEAISYVSAVKAADGGKKAGIAVGAGRTVIAGAIAGGGVPDLSICATPSENPKHREQLTVEVSNGLKVRSKGELEIAEGLLHFYILYQYEKKLILKKLRVRSDGEVWTEEIEVYPDFTIFLPDGSEIYWEHCGLYDREKYRKDNHEKFDLYYDNGIYPPKNLIITMDGPGKPFSNIDMRQIIQGVLLPRMR